MISTIIFGYMIVKVVTIDLLSRVKNRFYK
jgi:hypothetical protein